MGSLLHLNFTRNSCRSEIISHFRPGTGPVRSSVARCGPLRLIVTPHMRPYVVKRDIIIVLHRQHDRRRFS